MRLGLAIFLLFLVNWGHAEEALPYQLTSEEQQHNLERNQWLAQLDRGHPTLFSSDSPLSFSLLDSTEATPYAEYHEAGYLIFSYNFSFGSRKAKMTMAENLPEGVKLVIFTETASAKEVRRLKKLYKPFIDPERLHIIYMRRADRGFWARDGVPVPVWRAPVGAPQRQDIFTVVDAYYGRFDEGKHFANLFYAEMTDYDYAFEGGNFIANSKNHCLVVNTPATKGIPTSIFRKHYGCKVLTRLPYVKGIGHADESVKFVDDQTVLTDEKSYVKLLEGKGYKVIMLPRPKRTYETYVNSLIINGTVFVPIFGQKKDEQALQVYRDLGFEKVIGINTVSLSNNGLGSLHCITMTYPPVEMNKLLHNMGGVLLK